MRAVSPGTANHSSADPVISISPNAAIHGLRRPEASATAPSTGEKTAMTSPAAPVAKPHRLCPSAGVEATAEAK